MSEENTFMKNVSGIQKSALPKNANGISSRTTYKLKVSDHNSLNINLVLLLMELRVVFRTIQSTIETCAHPVGCALFSQFPIAKVGEWQRLV